MCTLNLGDRFHCLSLSLSTPPSHTNTPIHPHTLYPRVLSFTHTQTPSAILSLFHTHPSIRSLSLSTTMHHTCDFFEFCDTSTPKEDSNYSIYGLVVLNYHLPVITPHLWTKAYIRLCADGGANRIYDGLPALLPHEDPVKVRERYKPDVIKGDMDSIRPEVKEFYAGLGTIILDESHDQDTTDLHKCVAYIKDSELSSNMPNLKVLVVGALGGRFDHELANINVLYTFSNLRIILLNDDNVAFLLPKNCHHEIKINLDLHGPHCGLVPLGAASKSTTTTGLKWNLDNQAMCFGSLISTSNICESEIVTVFSDADLVWTISTQKLHDWALHQIHKQKNSIH